MYNPISKSNRDKKANFFFIKANQKLTWADQGFESVCIIDFP